MVKIAFTLPGGIRLEDTIAFKCYKKLSCIPYIVSYGASIAHVRNTAVNENDSHKIFQKDFSFDKILFIDYDIEFTGEDVSKIFSYDHWVIGGAYKCSEYCYTAGPWMGIPGNVSHAGINTTGIHKVDWIGTGFLCIDRKVFETIQYPWFEGILIETADEAVETSEDIGLMLKLRKYNIPAFCDFDVVLKHHKVGLL